MDGKGAEVALLRWHDVRRWRARLARQIVRLRHGYYPPTLQSGEFYVPPLGAERVELHSDLVSVHHLLRYAWAVQVLHELRPKRVLDVACGCGYGTAQLADANPKGLVFGLDKNRDALGYARKHYARANNRFVRGDACRVGSRFRQGFFDAIVSFDTLEHLVEPVIFLQSLANLLSWHGALLLSVPSGPERREVYNEWHRFEPTFEELEAIVRTFFYDVRRAATLPRIDLFRAINERFGRVVYPTGAWNPLFLSHPRRP